MSNDEIKFNSKLSLVDSEYYDSHIKILVVDGITTKINISSALRDDLKTIYGNDYFQEFVNTYSDLVTRYGVSVEQLHQFLANEGY